MLPYILAFLNAIVLDVVYAKYTIHTANRRPLPASLYAAGTILGGGFNVVNYAHHGWGPIFAAGFGAIVGTYFTVAIERDSHMEDEGYQT